MGFLKDNPILKLDSFPKPQRVRGRKHVIRVGREQRRPRALFSAGDCGERPPARGSGALLPWGTGSALGGLWVNVPVERTPRTHCTPSGTQSGARLLTGTAGDRGGRSPSPSLSQCLRWKEPSVPGDAAVPARGQRLVSSLPMTPMAGNGKPLIRGRA